MNNRLVVHIKRWIRNAQIFTGCYELARYEMHMFSPNAGVRMATLRLARKYYVRYSRVADLMEYISRPEWWVTDDLKKENEYDPAN